MLVISFSVNSNGAVCCLHIASEVRGIHVGLPQLARLPVLKEHELRRIVVVAVQVIMDAAFFSVRDRNQLFQLYLDQINPIGVGANVCES